MGNAQERLLRQLSQEEKDAREDGKPFTEEVVHSAINEALNPPPNPKGGQK